MAASEIKMSLFSGFHKKTTIRFSNRMNHNSGHWGPTSKKQAREGPNLKIGPAIQEVDPDPYKEGILNTIK